MVDSRRDDECEDGALEANATDGTRRSSRARSSLPPSARPFVEPQRVGVPMCRPPSPRTHSKARHSERGMDGHQCSSARRDSTRNASMPSLIHAFLFFFSIEGHRSSSLSVLPSLEDAREAKRQRCTRGE
jgi:hypothetical protein